MNLQVALARSFYHVGEPSLSLAAIADAEKILAETPGLKRHRLLVLSQKALAARDGERWELAQKTYREVDDLLAGASDKQMASMWSRIRVRLGEASSALGGEKYEEALALLDEVDRWAEAVRGRNRLAMCADSVRCTSVRCGGGAADRLGSESPCQRGGSPV